MTNLRERRTALGLSQQALADILGVKRQAVHKWERGEPPQTAGGLELAMEVLERQAALGEAVEGIDVPTAEALREARDRLGMTQTQLADRLGVTQATVSRWEDGSPIQGGGIVALALRRMPTESGE